jgi:predicted GIY-YIG superfamily endonuclease
MFSPRDYAGQRMRYVYILQSEGAEEHFYVGQTDDLKARLARHHAGGVSHTSKFKPWRVKTYIAFSDETQAIAFEKYLKSPSGRAFARKRL